MSEASENQEPQVERPLTPLERIKARQAQARQNLAAKGTGSKGPVQPSGGAKTGDVSQKRMRSSASKQGG